MDGKKKYKRGKYYDPTEKKLVYIRDEPTPEMWHNRWNLNEQSLKKKLAKQDKRIIKITSRYLNPKDGVILEGGCGYGGKVYSLKQAGYEVIGIDFDYMTVSFLNKNAPDLDILLGDVRSLPLGESLIAGYWSIGVIEHFFEGFDDIAKEMVRVIKPGGYLFVSHPYMSPLRKIKAQLGLYPLLNCQNKPDGFYQFALNHKIVRKTFESIGFKLMLFKKVSGLMGFNEEIPFRPALALKAYKGNNKLVKGIRYLVDIFFSIFASHSCLMVFRLSQNTIKPLLSAGCISSSIYPMKKIKTKP